MDLGQPRGQRAVDVDRNRPDLVHAEELLKAVDHALGSTQAEGGNHDLALKPGRAGDDRVQLLDQSVVGIELAIAVGALRDQHVDVLNGRRVGQEVRVSATQVAGEDEPARTAVFAIVDLDDRRAQDVPGVEVRQSHSRHDFMRLLVGQSLDPLDHPLDVDQLEERLGRFDMRVPEMGVAHVLALDPRTVAQHDVGDVAGGGSGVDRPGVSRADQAGQSPDVVVVGVRDDHRVERAGVERELTIRAVGIDPIGVKQPAVEQKSRRANLQKMGTARDLPGRAMERDSQPSHLPTIDGKDANTSIMTGSGKRHKTKQRTLRTAEFPTEPHGPLWI